MEQIAKQLAEMIFGMWLFTFYYFELLRNYNSDNIDDFKDLIKGKIIYQDEKISIIIMACMWFVQLILMAYGGYLFVDNFLALTIG